jgi:hypothetical protein
MSNQFYCKNRNRLKVIEDKGGPNAIDYIEVATADQKRLKVFFLFDLPTLPGGVPLTEENIFIEGGVRIKNIKVKKVTASANVLTVDVDQAGDFSIYTLKIGSSLTDKDLPPDGFDQLLSSVEFSFKINCPADFDCKTPDDCLPASLDEPNIDYLAKDYSSFKRLMLDRMSTIIPDWKERNAADLQIALIELLAYVGDHLSYYQDAVATEAYIRTARRRISLKRHARLLDYFVHDGCNSRVWIFAEVEPGTFGYEMKQGTILMTNAKDDQTSVIEADLEKFINERYPVIFETMQMVKLYTAHNVISFYTWEDSDCCLPGGSTTATLLIEKDSDLFFKKDDVLIFEEIYSPGNGTKADADPSHRHAVRLKKDPVKAEDKLTGKKIMTIEWYEEDALPFSLCLTSPVKNKEGVEEKSKEKSFARGNIVLADHGVTQRNKKFEPVPTKRKYYPGIPEKNITSTVSYNTDMAAALCAIQDPHAALPSVSLLENLQTWNAKKDLLSSDRFATEFVVETEEDGSSFLRFGDNIQGKKPGEDTSFQISYRVGNGKQGNVGRDSINIIVSDDGIVSKVRNPLPAKGGINAETKEEIRQFAPQAFRTQERAVTEADYAEKTELHPAVQKAKAKFYWTGSWYTVFIIIDRKGGKELDEAFKKEIRQHLEQYRMAGYDLEIRQPEFVSLDVRLNVCVKPGYFKNNIRQSLLQQFSSTDLGDGTKGFFHPDNFTFGQPVFLSAIYQKAMSVEGVASVEMKEFKRWTKRKSAEIDDGILKVAELEIIRLDNDPNFPENGKIDFIMFGGL